MQPTAVLKDTHDRLAEAFVLLGQPEYYDQALAAFMGAFELLDAAVTAEPEILSAEAFTAALQQTFVRTLPSGRAVRWRPLEITSEILAGTLRNQVLEFVVFGVDLPERQTPKDAATYVYGMLTIAARALVEPRLCLSGTPGPGEIGPNALRPDDLRAIRQWALLDRLPEVAAAPFRSPDDDSGGAGAAG